MVYGALTVGNRQGRSYVLLTGCSRRERFRFSLTVSRRQERFGFCLMVGDRRGKFPWQQMKNWHRRSSLTALTVRNQSLTDFRQGKWTFPVSLFLTAYPWRLPSRITFPDGISHFPWRCRPSGKKFPGVVDVLAVYHPDDEVINSVIIARKIDAHAKGLQNGHAPARGAVPIVSPPCKCCKMEANALQKREEMATTELSIWCEKELLRSCAW